MSRSVVLVVGPGRSGTSSMAGTLAHSGFHVPGAIKANESNQRGFFEPKWAIGFHKRLLKDAEVRTLDTDPKAVDHFGRVLSSEQNRSELHDWIAQSLEANDRLVLKDPRMVWFRDLYVAACADLDVQPSYVVMLRHPSEVAASRSVQYDTDSVVAVCGWINVALVTEQLTAGSPRSFVHYPDLIGDWRAQADRLERQLGIEFTPSPSENPHPVDDFIDPSLRRMPSGWDGAAVPSELSDLADRVFDTLCELVDAPEDEKIRARVDELRSEYAQFYDMALKITGSRRQRRDGQVRRRTVKRTTQRIKAANEAPAPASLTGRIRSRLRGGN